MNLEAKEMQFPEGRHDMQRLTGRKGKKSNHKKEIACMKVGLENLNIQG